MATAEPHHNPDPRRLRPQAAAAAILFGAYLTLFLAVAGDAPDAAGRAAVIAVAGATPPSASAGASADPGMAGDPLAGEPGRRADGIDSARECRPGSASDSQCIFN